MEIIAAIAISFASVFILKPFAEKVGLVDKPNARKVHKGSIPLVGGIAFYIATMFACMLAFPSEKLITLFLISSAFVVFLGVLDDYHNLSVRSRIVSQILIASIMVFGADIYIHDLGNLVGLGSIDISVFGALLTFVAVIGAINAFNMTDGIDGLAGSLALNTFASVGILFYLANQQDFIALPIILVCAIVPYLAFNLSLVPGPVKKIFMGDAGSMFIGLSVIWLLTLGTQGDASKTGEAAFRTVTALWIIGIPLMDMAAIIYRRVRKGQSAFLPDRDHLHHIFLRAGFSSRQSLLIIFSLSCVYSGFGIAGEIYQIPEWIMFVSFLAVFSVYCYALIRVWKLVRWVRRSTVKRIRKRQAKLVSAKHL
ncbi:undecaprenyl-phosphate alpha-N-acetylglucosaminyl 1-phosphatetransferase [Catenovulum agarivorans DS-2]|uniref:Undecaprenyl-phosphate alpha-N-acetylglucosaminyl 1-phosphate transferase n=1 Tax=Catenovulum agarivorans DS-2 TaxID=1328313 RepID=W7Q8Z8_9ALTE|nr:UDP-N-acetylglucosamine--undecaprenyl-phosphate N-acetylglucosaminephosphotransferase [Catenovulum agarivorans]EWH08491.1 undecaprenyl-phosphate alpha-N-acetylglucosaminyl 1-phosphatetransferase [Catenovulum agarivorans DS-2]